MRKTNDTYCVVFRKGNRAVERYYRDRDGWMKVSSRGRIFRMTAEQVLNHLLPALAFAEALGITVEVQHDEIPYWQQPPGHGEDTPPPRGDNRRGVRPRPRSAG